jgi:protein arginine kinase activator
MLCDACKKNEATVHLTQIVENKMQTIDLCESCSKSKGVDDPTGFSLASLLMGLGSNQEAPPPVEASDLHCPRCNFSASDFKKSGRLGCPECYGTFAEPLQSLLKSMHKGTKHSGKKPHGQQKQDTAQQLRILQAQLEQAIAKEDFETAVFLRDKIKKIKALEQVPSKS